MRVTICGGGNTGHVIAGYLASQEGVSVSLLTTQPGRWSGEISVTDPEGRIFKGKIDRVSSEAEEVIPQADIVLLCLPGYAIGPELRKIAAHLGGGTWVGTAVSSTGFFFAAHEILSQTQPLFGFQRVPFISRIVEYGKTAELKGYKSSLRVVVERAEDRETVRATLERLFGVGVELLDSYYEVSLSNSNPLLHTSRLYSMLREWKPGVEYVENPQFYEGWTDEASELLIAMDEEFQGLLRAIGLRAGSIPPILEYYESVDARSLTNKIRSIVAFQNIASPMIKTEGGKYVPDFNSRYFTEDFLYGMRFIVESAAKYNVMIPTISRVYAWGSEQVSKYTTFRIEK